jgi:tetratricopeptide (TPR) repeat protein
MKERYWTQVGAAVACALALLVACGQEVTEETGASQPTGEIPVTTASESARELFEEGQYLLDVGRGVEARTKFQAAVAEDPGFVRAHFNQSNSALSFQEFQSCLDTASEHLEGASEGERLLVEINRTFLTNDTDRGLELGRELAAAYPESARAAIVLAGLQAGQNDNLGARQTFERALGLEPDSAGALFGISFNYLFGEPKDFAKAEEWAQKAVATYPEEAKAYELLGDIKRGQNDLDSALAAYNRASELDPQMANAHHKRGHVNSFLGNIEDARAAYDSGVEVAQPESKGNLAVYKTFTRLHEGDIPAALEELQALADGVEELGTPADQVKGLKTFVLNSRATAALHAGDLDAAAESIAAANELRMAIAADVGTEDAERLQKATCHQWDGLLAAYSGDREAAAEHADAIGALVADDANPRKMEPVHYVLGMSALQAGDHTTAVEELRKANHANNMYIRYHLALAEEAVGNSEEAARMFDEVGRFNFNSVGFALVGRDARERSTS